MRLFSMEFFKEKRRKSTHSMTAGLTIPQLSCLYVDFEFLFIRSVDQLSTSNIGCATASGQLLRLESLSGAVNTEPRPLFA